MDDEKKAKQDSGGDGNASNEDQEELQADPDLVTYVEKGADKEEKK